MSSDLFGVVPSGAQDRQKVEFKDVTWCVCGCAGCGGEVAINTHSFAWALKSDLHGCWCAQGLVMCPACWEEETDRYLEQVAREMEDEDA